MRVVVLADTHMRRGWNRQLPGPAVALIETADVILHAGDVIHGFVLDELAAYAPIHTVLGNNDTDLEGVLPETLEVELAGVRIGMIHDSGSRDGRAERLRDRFPGCDVVVFGHSHVPCNEPGVGGQLLFNPGSPTERRQQPHKTVGVLELADGAVLDARIVVVDD